MATPAPHGAGRSAAETSRRNHRWVDMAIAAVVAAVVASGVTAAIVHDHNTSTPASSSTTLNGSSAPAPVQQASSNAPDWATTAAAVEPSVVAITVGSEQSGSEAQGSGIILDTSGHILTNNHVATATSGPITVTLTNQNTYQATVVGTDPSTDLAVLKLSSPPADLRPASLGNSSALKVGQPVMAIGNPLGLADTVTTGIVSAMDRPVTTQNESQSQQQDPNSSADQVVTNAIQTDAAINPGNSGGPLVTSSGQVIGINSSIASLGDSSAFGGSSETGSIGLGFAIPINEAKNVAQQLISTGTVKHPYLGVTLQDGSVTSGGAKRAAAVIQSVNAGTPAAKAGLKKGDSVVSIDGNIVNGALSLTAQVRADAVGQTVKLSIVRGGAAQTISVTLAAHPASAG
jgi:putative serine protease PepD